MFDGMTESCEPCEKASPVDILPANLLSSMLSQRGATVRGNIVHTIIMISLPDYDLLLTSRYAHDLN